MGGCQTGSGSFPYQGCQLKYQAHVSTSYAPQPLPAAWSRGPPTAFVSGASSPYCSVEMVACCCSTGSCSLLCCACEYLKAQTHTLAPSETLHATWVSYAACLSIRVAHQSILSFHVSQGVCVPLTGMSERVRFDPPLCRSSGIHMTLDSNEVIRSCVRTRTPERVHADDKEQWGRCGAHDVCNM